jgi:hypothetical protein
MTREENGIRDARCRSGMLQLLLVGPVTHKHEAQITAAIFFTKQRDRFD